VSRGRRASWLLYVRLPDSPRRPTTAGGDPTVILDASRYRQWPPYAPDGIAKLSEDNLVMQGPVHPDFRLIGLCAEGLHLAKQHRGVGIMRAERFNSGKAWTVQERAEQDAAYETEKALRQQVGAMLHSRQLVSTRRHCSRCPRRRRQVSGHRSPPI
jgi:hypothetical protein